MFSQHKFPQWQWNFPRFSTRIYEKPLSCFVTVSIHLPLFTRQNIMVFNTQYIPLMALYPTLQVIAQTTHSSCLCFPSACSPNSTWVASTKSAACASVLSDSWFLSSTSEQLLTRAHLHRTLKRDSSTDKKERGGRVSWAPWATDAFPATSAVDSGVSLSFVVVDIICN